MEERKLTCICCPRGCQIHVELEEGRIVSVTGNSCKKGDQYARKELTHPTRIVTSTVRVRGGVRPVVSVKTAADLPKTAIFDCVRALKQVEVPAPVAIGQVLLRDVAGTGVDVVSTARVERK